MMRRVFAHEVLTCPKCGGKRRVLAATTQPEAIRKILTHLGLDAEMPIIAPARAPPAAALPFA